MTIDVRNEAMQSDALSDAQVPLALVWEALKAGVCRVVDAFFTSTRCYVTTAAVACHRPALDGRRLEILERILSGAVQTTVAFEMSLAPSTIALKARLGLRSIGVTSKPSRVHPLLLLAARAGRTCDMSIMGTASVVFGSHVALRTIALPRPDAALETLLPPAELAVVRGLVEGRSYEEIALQRGTSQRTIANQIAAVFRRKQVSGRNDLVHHLFSESAAVSTSGSTTLPPALRSSVWGPLELVAS